MTPGGWGKQLIYSDCHAKMRFTCYAYRAEAMPIGRHLWGKRRVERRGEHLHAYRAEAMAEARCRSGRRRRAIRTSRQISFLGYCWNVRGRVRAERL